MSRRRANSTVAADNIKKKSIVFNPVPEDDQEVAGCGAALDEVRLQEGVANPVSVEDRELWDMLREINSIRPRDYRIENKGKRRLNFKGIVETLVSKGVPEEGLQQAVNRG